VNIKTALLATLLVSISPFISADPNIKLEGAGATFPAPLYKQWVKTYQKIDPDAVIRYDVVGSGEGVSRFLADEVDFGASDAPLTEEQTKAAKHGAVSIPVTAGMIVLIYNLPRLNGPLKLSRDTYVALLMGKIPRWNDARIQSINPTLNLPDREIFLVARLDSSGTTHALTKHLDAVNANWSKRGPGVGKLVTWPAESMLVNGNEGVASRVKLSVGAVGYVEYGFARQLNLPMAQLENKAGNFIVPSGDAGLVSLEANPAKSEQEIRNVLTDPAGDNSYPMLSFSWLLLKKDYRDTAKSTATKRFVTWGLDAGQESAPAMGYIRLPANVRQMSKDLLNNVR
jgi:phosphate transport system substrate-binding protein